jgi:hypothetical protein
VKVLQEQFADPMWRLSNLYYIIDKAGNEVQFVPNTAQAEFLQNFHTRNLILKARQLGFTTLCCLLYLDDCVFTPNTAAAVIAHKLDDAKIIFQTKVKFPWERLPDGIKAKVGLAQDSAELLRFGNDSMIRVSTSTRSGTVKWLHISEYGKICAIFPEKAREIRTGAFPSAQQGIITIESTAEGEGGDFYQKSMDALNIARAGREISELDFKFHFAPWWKDTNLALPNAVVGPTPDDTNYFDSVEETIGQELTLAQRNWWLATERDLGGDMKREYPATPEEAFAQAIEGAYFVHDLASAYKHHRIGEHPFDPGLPVHTAWDLGRNDFNVIGLWQDVGPYANFIYAFADQNKWIGDYIQELEAWRKEHGAVWGEHYLPHDGKKQELWLPEGTMKVMSDLGFFPEIVERPTNKQESINVTRRKFSRLRFDEAGCKELLKYLKRYRKEWDEKFEVWKPKPAHDEASHWADMLQTWANAPHRSHARIAKPRPERYTEASARRLRTQWQRKRRGYMAR